MSKKGNSAANAAANAAANSAANATTYTAANADAAANAPDAATTAAALRNENETECHIIDIGYGQLDMDVLCEAKKRMERRIAISCAPRIYCKKS